MSVLQNVATLDRSLAGACVGMRMDAVITYDPVLVGASIVIALGASTSALWLFSECCLTCGPRCAPMYSRAGLKTTDHI